jgi:chromosome segregation protein
MFGDLPENVGNVNLKALEEYEEMERKKEEVTTEVKALEKEKRELEKLIEEINDKRKTEFLHVFEGIDKNFREIYKHVSGGGEAYFELENPEDPLSGGLNIHARPPGKKMTRLGALSGGEKSLTSMAFIFSVQAWDPSPFYLLDEVDQNLDAINAEIIARMVRDNASFAQFVMISLRKISLKEAHHLYGVTLQNGESVVLGRVDLKEVEKYEKGAAAEGGSISQEGEAA